MSCFDELLIMLLPPASQAGFCFATWMRLCRRKAADMQSVHRKTVTGTPIDMAIMAAVLNPGDECAEVFVGGRLLRTANQCFCFQN